MNVASENPPPAARGRWLEALATLCLLVALPLAGLLAAGRPLAPYLEFPPRTRYVTHAPFSWPVFLVLAGVILAVLWPFERRVFAARRAMPPEPAPARRFPAWGWAGVAFGLAAWLLAWTRFAWFRPWQPFTFTPLWIAYVVVVNAWTWRRTGHCLLRDRPRYLARLGALSAVFWWLFEYLNRFVQNWHYVGIAEMSPWQYALFATLPFSTVLPAVMSTAELLGSIPRAGAGLDGFAPLRLRRPRPAAALALLLAAAGLAGQGLWPDLLFPLLWVSPLLLLTALQALRGRPTIFDPIAAGRWRRLYLLAAAALICGFFWEMWNYGSLAKWVYAVPFVHRFLLFEMPLLGYAGYLPFGLECAAAAEWAQPSAPSAAK